MFQNSNDADKKLVISHLNRVKLRIKKSMTTERFRESAQDDTRARWQYTVPHSTRETTDRHFRWVFY